jgi:arylsulfatase A-like enzyme
MAPFCANLALSACGGVEATRPDVLLVSLDTTRADALGPYGGGASTPALDRLATESVVFWDAVTPMPSTRPAHASLLLGIAPREHGVGDNATPLSPDAGATLAERLGAVGYRTAAFTAASVLDRSSGLDRGFDDFFSTGGRPQRAGAAVADEVVAWLGKGEREPRPLFLWVHFFDPHMPYGDPTGPLRFERHLLPGLLRDGDLPAPELERIRRLYERDVEQMDRALSALLEATLWAPGRREWVVVVVADHGECFEHGYYFEHGACLWEGAVRVPLLLRVPGMPARAERAPVSLVDVAGTILDLVGLHPGAGPTLLAPHADRIRVAERWPPAPATIARRRDRQAELRSVAGSPVRLRPRELGQSAWETRWLLVSDPPDLDLVERTDDAPASAHKRERALSRLQAELDRFAERELPTPPSSIDAETRRQLEALGYL